MLTLSKMAASVKPSATLAAGAKAKQMKAEGIDVFDFSLGEPDFNTPDHICQAAIKAMNEGQTHYTPAPGIPDVRKAVANFYKEAYGYEVGFDQVIVSNGAKHSLHNTLSVLCGPGDEVIIPTPYWVSYSALVEMTGATVVLVPTSADNQFKMTPEQLQAAITPKSKLVMLNSPSNPTGVVYTRDELSALATVILQSNLGVLSDEIYEKLVYGDNKPTCFATLDPKLPERTITISGVSKSYAMTGWRMGWAVGPAPIIKAMSSVQSQQTGNPSSITQHAVIAALTGDQQCVEDMRQKFAERRELVLSRLKTMGLPCPNPGGAFYAFFDVSKYFGKTYGNQQVTDSLSFCEVVLEQAHVNLVPGVAFGAEGFVRMSFATSVEQINGGLDKLSAFLDG